MRKSLSQRDVVLIEFPFSNMYQSKVRPVIVMSNDNYNQKFRDFIAIPLTSQIHHRDYAFMITNKEMESGKLKQDCQTKVDRIYSLEQDHIVKKIGRIRTDVHRKLRNSLLRII